MSKLRVSCFSVSLDEFGAGPNQSVDNPLGVGGEALHEWIVPTRTFQAMTRREQAFRDHPLSGKSEGTSAPTTHLRRAASRMSAPGSSAATCSARSGARGPTRAGKAGGATTRRTTWPVFVLTHHARKPIEMEGGTTFHFVTDGIQSALEQGEGRGRG